MQGYPVSIFKTTECPNNLIKARTEATGETILNKPMKFQEATEIYECEESYYIY